jgi:predicted membrane metal-binding protein
MSYAVHGLVRIFHRTGSTHLAAISGLRVGFLGLIGYLLGRLR